MNLHDDSKTQPEFAQLESGTYNQYGYDGWVQGELNTSLSSFEDDDETTADICSNKTTRVEEQKEEHNDDNHNHEHAQQHIFKLVESFKQHVTISLQAQQQESKEQDEEESKEQYENYLDDKKRYMERLFRRKNAGRLDQRVSWADQPQQASI